MLGGDRIQERRRVVRAASRVIEDVMQPKECHEAASGPSASRQVPEKEKFVGAGS